MIPIRKNEQIAESSGGAAAATDPAATDPPPPHAGRTDLQTALYAVSHDLGAPVRHIDAFVQLFLEGTSDPTDEQQEYAAHILRATGRLRDRLGALTRFAQETAPPKPGSIEPCDLDNTLSSVLAALAPRIEAADAHVTVEPLPTVVATRTGLSVVFTELLDNALRFAGEAPCIRVGSRIEDDHRVRIVVEDSGEGLPEGDAEKACRLFKQCHGRTDGTGTGLAIVQGVLAHFEGCGTIRESARGFCFEFLLRSAP